MTVIRKCDCKSEYQDSIYGLGNRVYNEGKDRLRCTICKNVIADNRTPKKKSDKKDESDD